MNALCVFHEAAKEKSMNYDIRDISLAPGGHMKIEWVRNNMPLLSVLEEDFKKKSPLQA